MLKTKKLVVLWASLAIVVYLYFVLSSNHLVKWPLKFEVDRLIYPQNLYQLEIDRQQKDSMYLPYQLRLLIFNEKTSYGYVFISNIISFMSICRAARAGSSPSARTVWAGCFPARSPDMRRMTARDSRLLFSRVSPAQVHELRKAFSQAAA